MSLSKSFLRISERKSEARVHGSQPHRLIAIVGPTASGKSELAALLARRFSGEVVSADSRQVYRGLDIGTGKVPRDKKSNPPASGQVQNPKQRHGYFYKDVQHYLIDVASPRKTFTVAQYRRHARKTIADILRRNKLPILCGGTGFYVDAALYNFPLPAAPPQAALRRTFEKIPTDILFERLRALDPVRAVSIDRHNRRRLIRALEIVEATGAPIPPLPLRESDFLILKIGVRVETEKLKRRIKKRFILWLRQGLIREVQRLRELGCSWKRVEGFGLEYRAVALYLQQKITRQEMIEMSLREIGKYAKRQMTWFKRDTDTRWVDKPGEAIALAKVFLRD